MRQDAEQDDLLAAVTSRLESAILDFCALHQQQTFHADDLRQYVAEQVGVCAPGSSDRVLRKLRKDGIINYDCLSRSKSLYVVLASSRKFDLL